MKNIYKITIVLVLIINTNLFSQILPEKALDMPGKYFYSQPVYGGADYAPTNDKATMAWLVFSDRENNNTYLTKECKNVKNKLKYLEKIYVIAESGMKVRLVKDPKMDFYGNLSSEAKDYGWISKDKLLLYKSCLVTPGSKFHKKAMVLNTMKSTEENNINERNADIIDFYKEPGLKIESEHQSKLYQVFYIFKKEGNAVLLGKVYKIRDETFVRRDIFGWVSLNRINFWDSRIAIEPNYNTAAANERKSLNIPVIFVRDEASALQYKNNEPVNPNIIYWDADPFENRNIGEWRRFPVLKNKNGILKVGIMGEINSESGSITAGENAITQREYNINRDAKRNINVVFVIDGTTSMSPYFKPVTTALKNSMDELGLKFTNNTFRFASVVYRDFAEGARKIQTLSLSNDKNKVMTFLNNINPIDYNDTDPPEAVYLGLKTALRQVGLKKEETNIIVLIGDAGNHHRDDNTQVSEETIKSLLLDYECHFIAFQVANKLVSNSNSNYKYDYDEFIHQAKSLILSVANESYNINKTLAENVNIELPPPVFTEKDNNILFLEGGTFIGKIIYCTKQEKSVSPDALQQEIENIVEASNNMINLLLSISDKIIIDGANINTATEVIELTASDEIITSAQNYVSSFTPAVINMLKSMHSLDNKKIKILCDRKYQFYMPGWAPTTVKGLQYPLFKPCLFLTRKELGKLLTDFEVFADVYNAGNQRQAMYNAWIGLLQKHIGDIAIKDLMDTPMEEITEKIFGLPSKSSLLKNVKLNHITDPSILSDGEFNKIVIEIERKQRNLDKIYSKQYYDYSFSSNDETYYWISEDLLP